LWTVANQFAGSAKFLLDIELINRDLTFGRHSIRRKGFESRRFTSSIDSQKGETFSIVQAKANPLHSKERLSQHRCVGLSEISDANNVTLGLAYAPLFRNDVFIQFEGHVAWWDLPSGVAPAAAE
jgi:hypothetical protein